MGRRFKEQGPGPGSTSLPIAAGRQYREALHIIAMRRNMKLNQLVYDIIHAELGDEVAQVQALFFADSDINITQSRDKNAYSVDSDNEQA